MRKTTSILSLVLAVLFLAAPAADAGTVVAKALDAATSTGASNWIRTQDNGTSTGPGTVGAVQVTLYATGSTTSSVTFQVSPDAATASALTAYTFTNIGTTPVTIQCAPSPYSRLNYASGTGTITGFITTMAAPSETGPCHVLTAPSTTTIASTTGSGALVQATSPTLVTPTLGVATATSINGLTVTTSTGTLTIANGKTLDVLKTLTLDGTDSTTMTFPSTSATIARTDAAQTFTGVQTFSSIPVFSAGVQSGVTAKSTDGAISVSAGVIVITKASALGSSTLATPTATTHDGYVLRFVSTTAFAHVITVASGKINGGSNTTITFTSAAIGDSVTLVAWNGVWYTMASRGTITIS